MITSSSNTIDQTGAMATDIEIITESSELTALSIDDLDNVSGGAHQASGSNFDRHRTKMKGSTFAGPDGGGSSFSLETEDISSSAWESQGDD
jgi:hypothetical protein